MAKIVVCEDSAIILQAIVTTLRAGGHQLFVAADGSRGLELVENEHPDLLLCDVAMPGMSGYELVDSIRARPGLQSVRIILVSAAAQRADIDEGYRHGAVDYITKPFSVADLRARVERALREEADSERG
jgi:two-component system phosphate regulon response regulator PhoB